MRALTVEPGRAGTVGILDVPDPDPNAGDLLVDGIAVGVCGTDREIAAGGYGSAPPGHDRLVLGHESLGTVRTAPADSGFAAGDLVVGVVRRPDPVPCGACARGEFDMCRNGRYTERGIKDLDGYGSQQWRVEAGYAVKLDPQLADVGVLMEPTGRRISVDVGAANREIVLENDAIVGSVNANLRHYTAAADALADADLGWLDRLITRRVPLDRANEAFEPDRNGIKTIVMLH